LISRRTFTAGMAGAALLPAKARAATLPPWRPGMLDLHFIATGRGDATLIVAPSGRMALIDVGAAAGTGPAMVAPLPDGLLSPGRRVADYIQRRLAETGGARLDTLAITHFHDDHLGGVADLLARIDVAMILDRAWPDYGNPPFEGPAGGVYASLMRERAQRGGGVGRLRVGATGQVLPGVGGAAPFDIRTVAAGGAVWTGAGHGARAIFQRSGSGAATDGPNENANSVAFLVTLGRFRAFLGGDLTDWADAGTRPWLNALTPAAQACGPVHVSTLPHHGMFDASSPATLRALAARDWVISAWHAAHPSIETLERVFSPRLYPGQRDIWATALHPAVDVTMGRLTRQLASRYGTLVCRVGASGNTWSIAVTDPAAEALLNLSGARRMN
jgi:beta-lactamase superfamily II metal-dependent hydrolase